MAQYAPAVAKKAVIGHGAGTKEQVRAMVTTILRMERTPDLLPILKQAGVVDSGGQGLVYIFAGMMRASA